MAKADDGKPDDAADTLPDEFLRKIGPQLYAEAREASEREEFELAHWRAERKKDSPIEGYAPEQFEFLWRNGEDRGGAD